MATKKRSKKITASRKGVVEKYALYKESHNRLLYWTTILVLAICNFLISILIVPLLLVVNQPQVFVIIAMLGFFFGFVFNLLVTKIEHLEIKHHVFAAVFIPVISIINIFILVNLTNKLVSITKIGSSQNSLTISIIYVAAFMLPYLYGITIKPKEKKIFK